MIGNNHRKFWIAFLTVLCCSFLFITQSAGAQAPQPQKTGKLTVNITGIRNTDGNIRVTLRSDENTVVTTSVVDIDPKTLAAEAIFDNLPAGDYGVAVIHDENKNGKLDFNEVGMPLEGYGHSNNPAKRPGPPDFNETKFAFAGPGTTITVNLIYWP
jgi:uncharacterized protein (DUF2141 family)